MLIPGTYDKEAEESTTPLLDLIPKKYMEFSDRVLDEAGIPRLPDDIQEELRKRLTARDKNVTPAGARRLIEVALRHPQIRLFVGALGPMPKELVEEFHRRDIIVGGQCGKGKHALRHLDVGTDFLIAQGSEAGGHTGEISTMVLVPDVVKHAAGKMSVLAAGGISHGSQILAAQAMGAVGVWTGTIWLGTAESELTPFEKEALFAADAEDAVRRKVLSGKTVRMIRSKYTEAWEGPESPGYLPAPLQGLVFLQARARIDRAQNKEFYSSPAGQVIGGMTEETTVREVMYRLQNEYADAVDRVSGIIG